SLAVDSNTGRATLLGSATVRDVTSNSSATLDNTARFQLTMVDRGEPGGDDLIAITVWQSAGLLWFSSRWNGAQTIEQKLDGGNLQLHRPNLDSSTKFYVVDPVARATFRYNPAGVKLGQFNVIGSANVRGVAANAAGDTVWVMNGTTRSVNVFDN